MIDPAVVRTNIVDHLRVLGWEPRDSDNADFAHSDSDLRFKVGTKYGEVTVTVWHGVRQVQAIRILSYVQESEAKQLLAGLTLGAVAFL